MGAVWAGASVAALLAEERRVLLLEAEDRVGYHATGRSAALFSEIYGNRSIRALTRGSRGFLRAPPPGFTDAPLIRPRASLFIATERQLDTLHGFAALPDVAPATRALSALEALALCPALRADYLAAGLLEPDSADLDVHALHQGYLRWLRARGGEFRCSSPVLGLTRGAGGWRVRAGAEEHAAPVVVNAAGAWADELARCAGLAPLGLTPLRRTAALVDPPPGMAV